jgi:hypothetical protein
MPWWGWLIIGIAGGGLLGYGIGYATALFAIGRGLLG